MASAAFVPALRRRMQRGGVRQPWPSQPGIFVADVGDMMARSVNDRFASTTRRVGDFMPGSNARDWNKVAVVG